MADIVDQKTRRRMMSGIRGQDTKPEILIRKALFARGFRYRLNDKRLPGKPDLVFPKYKAIVFVHGCFWHGHNCPLFKLPATNTEFWRNKIEANSKRDIFQRHELQSAGWRVLTVWECAIRGKRKLGLEATIDLMARWLLGDYGPEEIKGK